MTEQHYTQLVSLLNEKITRLERDKDEQRREINRLKAELRKARKENQTNETEERDNGQSNC